MIEGGMIEGGEPGVGGVRDPASPIIPVFKSTPSIV
jgi:hypothetical protein